MLLTMATTMRTPNWWDDAGDEYLRPGYATDHVRQASDLLSFAFASQTVAGGDQSIAAHMDSWCLELKRRPIGMASVIAVLHGLDRLDRHACEPHTWQHLKAAEIALAAFLVQARGG